MCFWAGRGGGGADVDRPERGSKGPAASARTAEQQRQVGCDDLDGSLSKL